MFYKFLESLSKFQRIRWETNDKNSDIRMWFFHTNLELSGQVPDSPVMSLRLTLSYTTAEGFKMSQKTFRMLL